MERHALATVPDWLRRYNAFAVFSHDDGRTWVEPGATLNDSDERVVYYDQRMVALPDGRLLTMAWVHDVVDDVTLTARAAYSDDRGRTGNLRPSPDPPQRGLGLFLPRRCLGGA